MFKAKTLFVSILLVSLTFSPGLVGANDWTERAVNGGLGDIGSEAFNNNGDPQQSMQEIVANIVKVFLGLLGIIFVVLLILAGFKYMTAGGDQEKIQDAVSQIKNAVIGLLIIVAAYAITYFITVTVLPKLI